MLGASSTQGAQRTEEHLQDLQAMVSNVELCSTDELWESAVSATRANDVYYRPCYARAHERAGHGRAIALVVSVGKSRFLVPMLLRPLSDLSFAEGAGGYDAITPYGYGGVLQLSGPEDISPETAQELCASLRAWCAEAGVISILLRLHPLLNQQDWFSGEIDGVELSRFGPTVAVDLHEWNPGAQMLSKLHKGRRSDLRVACRHLWATWASDERNFQQASENFRALYEGRMDQLHAGDFYYFPPEYYAELTSGLRDDLDIALAWHENTLVGGAIFMAGREFAHYHLSATNELGRTRRASTLLVHMGAEWAWRRGCRWLHLGGGTHGDDPLFRFKQSFGGVLLSYSFCRVVADKQRYRELTAKRMADASLPAPRTNFFPAYRA